MRSWMAKRLRSYTNSVFEEVTAMARRHDAVNLGSGTPDLPIPESLQAAVRQAIANRSNVRITFLTQNLMVSAGWDPPHGFMRVGALHPRSAFPSMGF